MEELFNVRFETNKKSDGHVLDSYIMLYLEPIAQSVEHRTFNPGVFVGSNPARFISTSRLCNQYCKCYFTLSCLWEIRSLLSVKRWLQTVD